MKYQTSYNLLDFTQNFGQFIKVCFDELIEKEMGSSTKVEKNDYKSVVE